MSSTKHFPAEARSALSAWFKEYGPNDQMEIEFRVQDVGEAGFERLLAALMANKAWTKAPVPVVTMDLMHATGIRETRAVSEGGQPVSKPPVFLRKTKGHEATVTTPSGFTVRFAVASEAECSADSSPVHLCRHKQRFTFEHKKLFKYELTRVKQGSTSQAAFDAEMQFEVELEFCGQRSADIGRPEYLADSMLMKAGDIVQQLAGSGADGPAAKRRRPDGALGECDPVKLKPGTEVQLEPSGHGVPARFGGELPAELAERVPWLLSHKEVSTPEP